MVTSNSNKLTITLPSDREILMTRTFDAPRDLVFEAFVKPEHIRNWWGPRGTVLTRCEMDVRVGGEWRFTERAQDGSEHPFKGEFREIARPERLVFTQIYDVEPYADKAALITIVLTEQDGRTLMHETLSFDSTEDRNGMLQSGMEGGATESLERLNEHLQTMKAA